MPKATANFEDTVCETALRLAAAQAWDKVTVEEIARGAKIPLAQIKKKYGSTNNILPLIVDYVGAQALRSMGKPDRGASAHDRLFEILMARFDVLQTWRKAILSIATSARRDPNAMMILAPEQIRGMKQALAFAGLDKAARCPLPLEVPLWGIYLAVFKIWQGDETLDMSRTMATLDRYLRYAGQAATFLRISNI